MLNQFLWENILQESKRQNLPLNKKRAILREFLQVKFITSFYRLPSCQKLSFIGGTSMRLLRGLDRFSEDLDFDNFGLTFKKTKQLFEKISAEFIREKFKLEPNFHQTQNGGIGRLRFSDLLNRLEISSNPKEKLMIRFDFTYQEKVETEVKLLALFGMSERVVANSLSVLLAQKTKALITRPQTRGRDFYDIYWLLTRSVEPNLVVLKKEGIETKKAFYMKLQEIYLKEKKKMPLYKKQIKPFLVNENNQRYLDLFEILIKQELSELNA